MKTILIISDVYIGEQVNGVGTWLIFTKKELEKKGFVVHIIDSRLFKNTFALPKYPEIRLVLTKVSSIERIIRSYKADHIHILTEGTLGLLASRACQKNNWKYTSAYHTRFPEYVFTITKSHLLKRVTYAYMRWFHNRSVATIVTTETMKKELENKHFKHLAVIPLGVDTQLFSRNTQAEVLSNLVAPIFVFFGRISKEKNIEAFLACNLPGSKLIIGDGPDKEKLEAKYKDTALFVGYKRGQDLVDLLSISHVSVFTSKTDTFGLTIIEALACGLPVAGFDVQGPKNVITNGKDGFLGDNLEKNCIQCLSLSGTECRKTAENYSWEKATEQFIELLSNVD